MSKVLKIRIKNLLKTLKKYSKEINRKRDIPNKVKYFTKNEFIFLEN